MNTKDKILAVNGIIILEKKYKEYDKLFTILTKELGKISVYAFGIRRPNSKNIGKARFFTFSTFEIRESKEKYQLENIIIKKNFDDLASDYDINCYASYFLELVDYFAQENIVCDDKINLLYYTFKALSEKKIEKRLIRRIFELKMLQYEGIYREKIESSDEVLNYTWQFIINNNNSKLYTFNLSEEKLELLENEMNVEMHENVTKKFKTLEFINEK